MDKKQGEQLKIKTNIPELIEFKSGEPKVGTGQYGEWYMYGIVNRGIDKVFFPTKFLNDKLQGFSPLQGKTLEVVLIEIDGGKKDWIVKSPTGELATYPQASNSAPQSVPSVPNGGFPTYDDLNAIIARIEKMAEWAKNIEKRLQGLETLEIAKNPEAVEFHQSFPAVKEDKFKFELNKVKEELNEPLNIQPPEGL